MTLLSDDFRKRRLCVASMHVFVYLPDSSKGLMIMLICSIFLSVIKTRNDPIFELYLPITHSTVMINIYVLLKTVMNIFYTVVFFSEKIFRII